MTATASVSSELTSQSATPERRLRLILKLNAASSAISAIVGIGAASYFADLLEVHVGVVVGVSIGLLIFAGRVAAVASRAQRRLAQQSRLIAVGDIVWVVGTVVVIFTDLVSNSGKVLLGLVAVGVLDFALAQLWFARRLAAATFGR
ncbi:MAG: hypothetical protein GXP35_12150 [Actinobacteria bacterium]|nr:hypothetical protein [Actinomycetota bacterium]